jgi:hypothetical protein
LTVSANDARLRTTTSQPEKSCTSTHPLEHNKLHKVPPDVSDNWSTSQGLHRPPTTPSNAIDVGLQHEPLPYPDHREAPAVAVAAGSR